MDGAAQPAGRPKCSSSTAYAQNEVAHEHFPQIAAAFGLERPWRRDARALESKKVLAWRRADAIAA